MKAEPANLRKGTSPLAGKPATPDMLIDVAKLERDYFERCHDVNDPTQLVSFGTSGIANPPCDGGFKYNPPNSGPADTDITGWIQNRANNLLRAGIINVKRVPFSTAIQAADSTLLKAHSEGSTWLPPVLNRRGC